MYIVFVADCHIQNFNFKRRAYGISDRTFDLIARMSFIVDHAVKNDAKMFVICGDLYDQSGYTPSSPDTWVNKPISPNIKKVFRKKILHPLLKKNIKVLVIGGNHDSHPNLDFGCDIEDLNLANNISVKRNVDVKKCTFNKERVSFITLPYIRPSAVFNYYINADGRFDGKQYDISAQSAAEYVSNHMIPGMVKKARENSDCAIMVGHYHVVGTRVTNLPVSFALREMEFNRTMIREQDIDLAVFGHIHQHQSLGDKIVVPGSIERMNFGERNDDKFFIGYDTDSRKWNAIEIPCRPMVQVNVDIPNGSANPTRDVISAIKSHDIEGALVKIVISSSPDARRKIDKLAINKVVEDAFHLYKIEENVAVEGKEEMIDLSGMELVPENLLERFINMKYFSKSDDYRNKLLERTLKYME